MEFSGKRKRGMYFQGSWYAWFSYARLSNFREVQLTHFVEVLRVKLCFVWNYSQGYWLGKVKKKKVLWEFSKKYVLNQPPAATHCPPSPHPRQGKLSVTIASLLKIYSPCVQDIYLYLFRLYIIYPKQSNKPNIFSYANYQEIQLRIW